MAAGVAYAHIAAMPPAMTIRDPLWDTIRIDGAARRIIDLPAFQRLRYIKQLGHAHLVYPGATHTRFDHAVGVYHLARRALAVLAERGDLDAVSPDDCTALPLAALLHDIGHYPFSHALEELAAGRIPGHHEDLVSRFLRQDELSRCIETAGDGAADRIESLIRGRSDSPLQGLVSGSLDLDKIEYLKRDARFCGVPYGEVDVDRLLHALVLLRDPATGRLELGVHEKGVAALESLLFAKYQMFRNVYWHHAVRAATVLYKRVVTDALDSGLIAGEELVGATDEALMHLLASRASALSESSLSESSVSWSGSSSSASSSPSSESVAASGASGSVGAAAAAVAAGVAALRTRQLPKRAAEVSAGELESGAGAAESGTAWLEEDTPLKRRFEDRLAQELGLASGGAYLDFPQKPAMFGLDLLLLRRSGEVSRLGPAGRAGLIGLPRVATELYRSARVLRLYTLGGRREVPATALARIARLGAAGAAAALDGGDRILD
jgi:uncharacterized protein